MNKVFFSFCYLIKAAIAFHAPGDNEVDAAKGDTTGTAITDQALNAFCSEGVMPRLMLP
jgi:zona occludens toxin (predicted ATPase)